MVDLFGSFVLFQVLFMLVFIAVVIVIIVRVLTILRGERESDVLKEREVIREIVKVRCRYCGQLYEERLDKCPNCGAQNA